MVASVQAASAMPRNDARCFLNVHNFFLLLFFSQVATFIYIYIYIYINVFEKRSRGGRGRGGARASALGQSSTTANTTSSSSSTTTTTTMRAPISDAYVANVLAEQFERQVCRQTSSNRQNTTFHLYAIYIFAFLKLQARVRDHSQSSSPPSSPRHSSTSTLTSASMSATSSPLPMSSLSSQQGVVRRVSLSAADVGYLLQVV